MLFSYLIVPVLNVVLNFLIEEIGVVIFSKGIDYGMKGFKRLKILEKDQAILFCAYIFCKTLQIHIMSSKMPDRFFNRLKLL